MIEIYHFDSDRNVSRATGFLNENSWFVVYIIGFDSKCSAGTFEFVDSGTFYPNFAIFGHTNDFILTSALSFR